ncbi:MAG: hypothetical protein LBJ59_04880 [Zoogloeaceae bacterium]|nr:hypothetical protein [Zoogloeaceae bacterium]
MTQRLRCYQESGCRKRIVDTVIRVGHPAPDPVISLKSGNPVTQVWSCLIDPSFHRKTNSG